MITRVLTAVVALSIILPPIVWGGYPGLAAVAAVATCVALVEFEQFIRQTPRRDLLVWEILAGQVVFWSVQTGNQTTVAGLSVAAILLFSIHLLKFTDINQAGRMAMGSLAALLYAPMLLATVPLIRRGEADGLHWLFFLFLVTWAGDTGGYLGGRLFGKHKLYPQVSPGKTVEGLIGGVIFAVGGAFLARAWFFPGLTYLECLVLAPLVDLAGVVGDLVESLLKRSCGVKDSGKIFPGHGGMLDRIDSLLFSAPVLYLWLLSTGKL